MPGNRREQAFDASGYAVVTVSYGSGDALEQFLSSLRTHHSSHLPVVVVDNKPDADNVRQLAERYSAKYVPLPSNPGYGAGMNVGVRALDVPAGGYFFCNPDVLFTEETVGHLAEVLEEEPRVGSIGPQLLNEDGTVYPSARNIPSLSTGIGHAIFGKIWKTNPWSLAYQNASEYASARPAGWLSGAAVMVRADVFLQIGGWDEEYFMHFEDIDLGYRISLHGYENRYDPSVSVIHSGAHSTKKHAELVERAMTESAVRFMRKRYSGTLNTPVRLLVTLGLRARGLVRMRMLQRARG